MWKDEILTWDPSAYDNITMIRIPISNAWTPGNKHSSEISFF